MLSRPMRARGLKPLTDEENRLIELSRPMRARGLKPGGSASALVRTQSRPMRARGLKPGRRPSHRSPRAVAPHAGAWIETWNTWGD